MPKEINHQGKTFYQCQECGLSYETKELAESCENWCKEYKSCNLEIVKNAVKLEKSNNLKNIFLGILFGLVIGFLFFKLPINLNNQSSIRINLFQNPRESVDNLIQEIQRQVLPNDGFQTKLVLGDAVKKMIDCGVIDLEKLKNLYQGKIPEYIQKAIEGTKEPIVINLETSGHLLNLFWPLGLSNKTEFNKNIPFSEKDLPYLASTGGWYLGKKENGAEYFNKCEIIKLTKEQEEIVYEVAQNTYRPCCNNSTFAQDCNHGSALLGALELAASQGYSKEELYRLALQLNSFWFPQNYLKVAAYFRLVENKKWEDLNPGEIMSAKYSSISGYLENIEKKLASLNIPQFQRSGSGCGL